MTFEATVEKKSKPDQTGSQEGFATGVDFVDAVLYSAIQRPTDGVAQIGAKVSTSLGGGDFHAPQMIAPLKEHQAWSGNWISQQAGNIVGSLPWIIGTHKIVRGLSGGAFAPTASTLPLARAGMGGLEAGLTGAAFEGILRPVDSGNFWTERAKNATAGFAAFSIMGGTASYFGRPLSAGGNSLRDRVFARGENAVVGMGAGAGGGIAHALTEDAFDKRTPTFERLSKSALEYGGFGMFLGAVSPVGKTSSAERLIPGKERLMEKESVPIRPGKMTAERAGQLADSALQNYNRGPKFYAEAQRNYSESLKINEHLYGKDSLQVAQNLEQLSSIHKAMGDYSGAANHLQQAITTYEAVGKSGLLPVNETPATLNRRLENLSDLYKVANKPDEVLRVERMISERQ